jgi:electron transport complex protein RnfG
MTERTPLGLKRSVYYHTALVGGFALLASTLLSLGDLITKDAIARRRADDLKSLLEQVIPPQYHDNDLLSDTVTFPSNELSKKELLVFRSRREDSVQAVAYETSVPGYAGPIVLVMGVDRNGILLGVRVVSHAETPGLGDKIETSKSDWLQGFNGRSLNNPTAEGWAVKKDGGEFDQFTGATITPRRAVKAVRRGLEFFDKHRLQLLGEKSDLDHAFPSDTETTLGRAQIPSNSPPSSGSVGSTQSHGASANSNSLNTAAIPGDIILLPTSEDGIRED